MYPFVGCSPILLALAATLFCWFMTALGSASVFFFKKIDRTLFSLVLGFSSGIMVAASFWSLLSPALELSEGGRIPSYIIVSSGFLVGALFTLASDAALEKMQNASALPPTRKKLTMLMGAITVHNIPEGLAVGVAFGALGENMSNGALAAAASVALGIALQNFPEGAAVSIPMREVGVSRGKSFFFGQLSGMVEPIAGVLGALLVGFVSPILPFALAFAAGSMMYVVAKELIPEANGLSRAYLPTLGFLVGFCIMMIMDTALA